MQSLAASGSRLTAHEAETLWRAWKTAGDAAARDRLVLSYAPMVQYLASKKVRELPAHCELDDLASCGLVALIECVDRFDPKLGATFEQYAWTRVSGAIMDDLRRQDWAPRSLRRLGRKMEKTQETLYAKNGTAPSDDEVSAVLGVDTSELRVAREELERAELVSLNAPVRSAGDAIPGEVGDLVEAAPGSHDPERTFLSRERAQQVRAAIESLDEREREIFTLVYVQKLSGAEIGEMFGVTESRVSQILGGVRRKLREHLDRYETSVAAA